MIGGISYVLATIAIALLIRVAVRGSKRSESTETTFRYSKGIRVALFCGGPFWVFAAVLCRATARPTDNLMVLDGLVALFGIFAIASLLVFVRYELFSVEVGKDWIRFRRLGLTHVIPFADVTSVEFRTLEKGQAVAIFSTREGARIKLTNLLQGYGRFGDLVRERSRTFGVQVLER